MRAKKQTVALREKKLKSGKVSLYLDYWPPITVDGHQTRREFLGIILEQGKETHIRDHNKKLMLLAEKTRNEKEYQIISGKLGFSNSNMSVVDYFAAYPKELASASQRSYSVLTTHWIDFAGSEISLTELNIDTCLRFREYLKNKNKRIETAQAYLRIFKATLKQMFKDGKKEQDLSLRIENFKYQKATESEKEHLTLAELKALAENPCPYPELYQIVFFAALTGLRISDVLELKPENVKFIDGRPVIDKIIKKTKRRVINPIGIDAFKMLPPAPENGEPYFTTKYPTLLTWLKKWLKMAGIEKDITFHNLRHSFAYNLLSLGVDIYTVSKGLNHTKVTTTEGYSKGVPEIQREAADKMKIFSK